jgi:hypothetical protein
VITPDPDFSSKTRMIGEIKEYFELQKQLGHSFIPWSKKDRHQQPLSPPVSGGYDSLSDLSQAIKECRKCPLHKARRQAVPGHGPLKTRMMIIGEGPGFEEDQQGKPFVGPAVKRISRESPLSDRPDNC